MKKITELLIKTILFPFKLFKWAFYFFLTYILLFTVGFIIDRYVGWHPTLRPVRDSTLIITMGIIRKATPYLESLASKFGEHENEKLQVVGSEPVQTREETADGSPVNTLIADTISHKLEQEQKIETSIQKLTNEMATLQTTINTLYKQEAEARISPLLYGVFIVSLSLSCVIIYLIYQKL